MPDFHHGLLGLTFDLDHLRRERHELIGELHVSAALPGIRTIDGVLSVGTFNVSSVEARARRAGLLRKQSDSELDFFSPLEELCQRVHTAERTGAPSRPLHSFDRPAADAAFDLDGLNLLRTHPTIWFGDGGSLKSYLALWSAGRIAQLGARPLLADAELSGEDHRDRLEQIFGAMMPTVDYLRCERALVDEVDRIKQSVRKNGNDFLICDSIAPLCGGPPEAAEYATAYYRALRQIGLGSLNLAHINRSDNGDQKPFGSTFWHNLARATWFVKQADASLDGRQITVGLFNRKANLTRVYPAVGFHVAFDAGRTAITRVNLADVEDLAGSLPLWQRMAHLLASGPLTLAALADELGANVDTLDRTVRRKNGLFTRVLTAPDGITRIALVERRVA